MTGWSSQARIRFPRKHRWRKTRARPEPRMRKAPRLSCGRIFSPRTETPPKFRISDPASQTQLTPRTLFSGLLGNLRPLLCREAFGPRLAAHAPQRHGGGVLAIIRGDVLDLAGRDPADQDGVADGVGGTLFPLGASWPCCLHPLGCLAASLY